MTFRRLRLLVAFLAALALPLQVVAGLTMPFCELGQSMQQASADDGGMTMPGDCPMHGHHAPSTSQAGSHCGFCQLAATGFMPTGESKAPVLRSVAAYAAATEAVPPSHISEPPQQPPRRFA